RALPVPRALASGGHARRARDAPRLRRRPRGSPDPGRVGRHARRPRAGRQSADQHGAAGLGGQLALDPRPDDVPRAARARGGGVDGDLAARCKPDLARRGGGHPRRPSPWRERTAMAMVLASPELTLGVPSVNLETRIAMPADRWTLFAGGARLGPAVLFWPLLVVVALAAVALGRLRLTPLGARHWFLLGVGLTQVPLYVGVIVAGWLLALGWRKERGATLGDGGFDLRQV